MADDPFEGPILKLERAKQHIEDFVAQADSFYKKISPRFFVQDNTKTHERALCVDIDTTVPDHFPLIIGDAIHNLRSALDHLTWEIVKPLNPPRPDEVYFPFCREAKSFEAILTKRQIKLASKEIVDKFRELKPYPGGNDLLYGLHKLDIADKHQLIVPVRSLVGFDRLDLSDLSPGFPIIENRAFTNIDKDNRLAVWRYDPSVPFVQPKKGADIEVTIQIMFRKEQPLGGHSVVASLRSLAIMVGGAIDSLIP
jgi:hypothetical protein